MFTLISFNNKAADFNSVINKKFNLSNQYTEKLLISIFTIVFFNLGKNVSLRIFVSKNTKLYNSDMKL